MDICYILLSHSNVELTKFKIRTLLQDPSASVVMHFDSNKSDKEIKSEFSEFNDRVLIVNQVEIDWGEWGIVDATLQCFFASKELPVQPDYYFLVSGSCFPIKPYKALKNFLKENEGQSFIEAVNAEKERWVYDGIQEERWQLYHYVNWRHNPNLFSKLIEWQKKLNIKRTIPEGLVPHMGSQWWVLHKSAVEKMWPYFENKKVSKFFKRTWVPDELYFQTLAGNLLDESEISSKKNLTFYEFELRGTPKVFHNDHLCKLLNQDNYFFARKLSPHAQRLRDELSVVYSMDLPSFAQKKLSENNRENENKAKTYNKVPNRLLYTFDDDWKKLNTWSSPYFVIMGAVEKDLRDIQSMINSKGIGNCHGYLFAEDHIEFVNNYENYSGYSDKSIAIRNEYPIDFLLDIIHVDVAGYSGFLLEFPNKETISTLEKIIWDKNAKIIHIQSLEAEHINKDEYLEKTSNLQKLNQLGVISDSKYTRMLEDLESRVFSHEKGFEKWVESAKAGYFPIRLDKTNNIEDIVEYIFKV